MPLCETSLNMCCKEGISEDFLKMNDVRGIKLASEHDIPSLGYSCPVASSGSIKENRRRRSTKPTVGSFWLGKRSRGEQGRL